MFLYVSTMDSGSPSPSPQAVMANNSSSESPDGRGRTGTYDLATYFFLWTNLTGSGQGFDYPTTRARGGFPVDAYAPDRLTLPLVLDAGTQWRVS